MEVRNYFTTELPASNQLNTSTHMMEVSVQMFPSTMQHYFLGDQAFNELIKVKNM
jgi:hypothetical protein